MVLYYRQFIYIVFKIKCNQVICIVKLRPLTPDPTHRIYRRSPESRELFGRVNVADMESPLYHAHVLRVANGFDDLLNKLHNHKVLDNMLSHLAEAHAVRNGLKKVYFEVGFIFYVIYLA